MKLIDEAINSSAYNRSEREQSRETPLPAAGSHIVVLSVLCGITEYVSMKTTTAAIHWNVELSVSASTVPPFVRQIQIDITHYNSEGPCWKDDHICTQKDFFHSCALYVLSWKDQQT